MWQFEKDLNSSTDVQDYLKLRGVSESAASDFRLGAVVNPPAGFERFSGTLAIPNLSGADDARPVGIKFRRLDDGKPKYDQPSGQQQRIFNLRALAEAQKTGLIYVTEGELDCIIISQLGYPCVGVPGADSFAAKGMHYRRRIFDGLKVVLIKDTDPSGEKLAHTLQKELSDVVVLDPSPAKDSNDLWTYLEYDEWEMHQWLSEV